MYVILDKILLRRYLFMLPDFRSFFLFVDLCGFFFNLVGIFPLAYALSIAECLPASNGLH